VYKKASVDKKAWVDKKASAYTVVTVFAGDVNASRTKNTSGLAARMLFLFFTFAFYL